MSTSSDKTHDKFESVFLLKVAASKSGNLDTSNMTEGTKKRMSFNYSNHDILNT